MTVQQTPLAPWHMANGAKMADFAGWSMPLWYPAGAVAEHLAVVNRAGLFDTSHMSVLLVQGPATFDLLQYCFTQDLSRVPPSAGVRGRCIYGVVLNPDGFVLDDAIVYPWDQNRYMMVVNAGMGPVISAHLQAQAAGREVTVTDWSGQVGKIDLQGPEAGRILFKILRNPEQTLADLAYFSFKGRLTLAGDDSPVCLENGSPILLSRTGYTGEFGFELFMAAKDLGKVWETILEAGKSKGLMPCGLSARDSLRAGAVLPLSHQDIGPWLFNRNPWTFALPLREGGQGFTKDFLGATAVLENPGEWTFPYVGHDPRKVTTSDPAVILDTNGRELGVVLTSVADMAIGRAEGRIFSVASPDRPADFKAKGLVCGYVRTRESLELGQKVQLKDQRRAIPVEIVADIRPHRTARRSMKDMIN